MDECGEGVSMLPVQFGPVTGPWAHRNIKKIIEEVRPTEIPKLSPGS